MTKALVVDDDPLSIEYVVEMLTTCGFTAETAVNGEDAVKIAENEVYDLIIMDIELAVNIDPVHIFFQYLSKYSVSFISKKIKDQTGY